MVLLYVDHPPHGGILTPWCHFTSTQPMVIYSPQGVHVLVHVEAPRRSSHRLHLPEAAEVARRVASVLDSVRHRLLQSRVVIAPAPSPRDDDDDDEDEDEEGATARARDDDPRREDGLLRRRDCALCRTGIGFCREEQNVTSNTLSR